ncbi:MAG: TIGR04282 family arsenosugar biosynthesis glycosyltransferase [Candidatus Omnitrophota bacterium]
MQIWCYMNKVLIIFVKYPDPGQVKTRLAQSIGLENANNIYKLFVPLIIKRTRSEEYTTKVFFDPPEKQEQIKQWLGHDWDLTAQSRGLLGDRLNNAFLSIFEQGAEKAVVIGTDSPLLDNQIIKKAFADLDKFDCVLGPSSSGGYYLLGINHPTPELFNIKEWSTNVVFEKTKQKAINLKLKLSILEEHFDVDEKEDLILLTHKLEQPEYCNDLYLNDFKQKINSSLKRS